MPCLNLTTAEVEMIQSALNLCAPENEPSFQCDLWHKIHGITGIVPNDSLETVLCDHVCKKAGV